MDYWGGQRVCWAPLSNYWGGLAPPPGPPSSYAYDKIDHIVRYDQTCLQLGFLISSQYSNRVVHYLRVNGPFELVYDIGGGRVVRWCWINFQCRVCPTYLDKSRARAYCSRSRCGWGLFGHFFSRLSFHFSFSLSLGDGPI